MSRLRTSSVLAAILFSLLALSACSPPSNTPSAYDDVTEANFIEGCTGIVSTSGTAENPSTSVVTDNGASSSVCKCQYDWFVQNVPFDQKTADTSGEPEQVNFKELNQQLQDDPTSMPQEIQDDLSAACGSSSVGENVTPGTGPSGTGPGTSIETTTSTVAP